MMEYELTNHVLGSSTLGSFFRYDEKFSEDNAPALQHFEDADLSFLEFNFSDFPCDLEPSTNTKPSNKTSHCDSLDIFAEYHPPAELLDPARLSRNDLDFDLNDPFLLDYNSENEAALFRRSEEDIYLGVMGIPLKSPFSSDSSQQNYDDLSFDAIETTFRPPSSTSSSVIETPFGSPFSSPPLPQQPYRSMETPLGLPSPASVDDATIDTVGVVAKNNLINNSSQFFNVNDSSFDVLNGVIDPSVSLCEGNSLGFAESACSDNSLSYPDDVDRNIITEHTYAKSLDSKKPYNSFDDMSPRSVDSGIYSDDVDANDCFSQLLSTECFLPAAHLAANIDFAKQNIKFLDSHTSVFPNTSNIPEKNIFSPLENKYKRHKSAEQKIRKKKQNRNAALKYRSKKKSEIHQVFSEADLLQTKNSELKSSVESLEKEIDYLKKLMMDIITTRLSKDSTHFQLIS